MKKFISGILMSAIVLALVLSGCKDGGKSSEVNETSGPEKTSSITASVGYEKDFDAKKIFDTEKISSVTVSVGCETDFANPPGTLNVEKENWQSVIDKLDSYGLKNGRESEERGGWDVSITFKMNDQKTYMISLCSTYASVSVCTGDELKENDFKTISDTYYDLSGFNVDDFRYLYE